jgi:ATP-dependent Clp protease adaptor protein ClpS
MDAVLAVKFNIFLHFHSPRFSRLAQEADCWYIGGMSQTAAPIAPPKTGKKEKTDPRELRDRGYVVICWNDPVNLMVYVTHVFQIVFGWPRARAERHMMQVHQAGKSALVRETFEKAEHYVHQLQGYGLQATMEREE